MGDHNTSTTLTPKAEPRSAPASPRLELKMEAAEEDAKARPTELEPPTREEQKSTPTPTPTPLDLSHREADKVASKQRRSAGVTLFPGLTITPGRGRGDDAPLTPSPTPSPPEQSFPRFHFGRGGAAPAAAAAHLPKTTTSTSSAANTSPSSPTLQRSQGRSQDGDGVGVESWWYPGLVGAELFRGLPDLQLPFPGLPAFREYYYSLSSHKLPVKITQLGRYAGDPREQGKGEGIQREQFITFP